MKFLKISMACIACFCIATSSYALTAVPEGQDQRIEWKLTKSWPTESKTLDMVYSLDVTKEQRPNKNRSLDVR